MRSNQPVYRRLAIGTLAQTARLVGRSHELALVTELVEAIRGGRGGGALVLGAPGVGKTRLLSEAARIARDLGVHVARSECLPLTTTLPFDPVLRVLRSVGPLQIPTAPSRRELFGEAIERLERVGAEGPLLICIDDLQWSDAGSLELIEYCSARLCDLPLGWVLAMRSGARSGTFAHRLERTGTTRRIELGVLTLAATRSLAEELLGAGRVSEDLAGVLFERTGGNPFLCAELLREIRSSGARAVRAEELIESVPLGVIDAVRDRVERLPAAARAALTWASVLPTPFGFEELDTLGGPGAAAAPELLADAGFLAPDGQGGWLFAHSILREAVYKAIPAADRVRRHSLVADMLKTGPLAQRAPQLAEARRWDEAAEAHLELAEAAAARGQDRDAGRLYGRSADFAGVIGDRALRRRAEAGRVLALVRVNDADSAVRAAERLRAELRSNGEPSERVRFLGQLAMALLMVHDSAGVQAVTDVLAEAEPLMRSADPRAVIEVLATRAWLSLLIGRPNSALADAEAATDLTSGSEAPALEARVQVCLGLAIGVARNPAEGAALLRDAAQHAAAADVSFDTGRAYAALAFLDELMGDDAAAEAHIQLGLAVEGLPAGVIAVLRSNLGLIRARRGDLAAGLAQELTAQRFAGRSGALIRARVGCALAYVQLWRGELDASRRLLETAELRPESPLDPRATELWGMLCEIEGSPDDALGHYRVGSAHEGPSSLDCEAGIARCAVAIGDLPSARDALERMDHLAERWPAGAWVREEARGWVAAGERRHADAARHLLTAADRSSRAYDAARLRLEASRLIGDPQQLTATIAVFEQMGATRAARQARAVARGLGMRLSRPHRRHGLLSAREHQVAELVVAGQTNREIAASLYLSPRTVERHVGSILSKLGYRSRVQLAAEAAAGRLPGTPQPNATR